jgi:hypothetical protein
MSELRLSFPACPIAGKSRPSSDESTKPRRGIPPHGVSTLEDAAAILALQDFHPENFEEWNAFFLETISEFIVHDSRSGASDDTGDRRLVLPAADFARLRAISDTIDPTLIDSEWRDFLARAEPCRETPKASRWLRVPDDIFALDGVAA